MPMAQEKLFEASQDPAIVKAVDAFVDAVEGLAEAKKKFEKNQSKLIGILKDYEKKRIRHRGLVIEFIRTESKEKLKVKGTPSGKEEVHLKL